MKHEGQGVGALKRGIRIGHKDEYRKSIVSASIGKGWYGDFDIAEPAPNDYGTVK